MQEKIEPVLVVGGGPVGLALAGDLGWRGIGCVLIEQSRRLDLSAAHGPRRHPHHGVLPALGPGAGASRRSPYPRDYAQDNVYLTSLTGYELGRERFPGIGQAPPPKESPQRRERCPQDMFDPILRAFASSQQERRAALPHPSSSRYAGRRTGDAPRSRTPTPAHARRSRRATSSAATGRAAWCARRSASACPAIRS